MSVKQFIGEVGKKPHILCSQIKLLTLLSADHIIRLPHTVPAGIVSLVKLCHHIVICGSVNQLALILVHIEPVIQQLLHPVQLKINLTLDHHRLIVDQLVLQHDRHGSVRPVHRRHGDAKILVQIRHLFTVGVFVDQPIAKSDPGHNGNHNQCKYHRNTFLHMVNNPFILISICRTTHIIPGEVVLSSATVKGKCIRCNPAL